MMPGTADGITAARAVPARPMPPNSRTVLVVGWHYRTLVPLLRQPASADVCAAKLVETSVGVGKFRRRLTPAAACGVLSRRQRPVRLCSGADAEDTGFGDLDLLAVGFVIPLTRTASASSTCCGQTRRPAQWWSPAPARPAAGQLSPMTRSPSCRAYRCRWERLGAGGRCLAASDGRVGHEVLRHSTVHERAAAW